MTKPHELFISATDAGALATLLGVHRRAQPFESDASDDLAGLLMEARLVPSEMLPADRIAMNSTVTYREEPSGALRTVTLSYPSDADASKGRISVLSPIGLVLIGRRCGDLVEAALPGNRLLKIRVVDTSGTVNPCRGKSSTTRPGVTPSSPGSRSMRNRPSTT